MSEKNISWFHCGRCGSLFQSVFGAVEERTCTSCGKNPSLGLEPPPSPIPAARTAEPSTPSGERHRQPVKRRKGDYLILKIAAAWVILLVAIVAGARYIWGGDPKESETPITQVEQRSPEDLAFINKVGPLCYNTFSGLLQGGSPEQQSQFVRDPISTSPRMARFYGMNPSPGIDPGNIQMTADAVVNLPGGPAYETQWTSADGHVFDAVFVNDNDEWRLDWEHYARFSDYPWALFLAGSGGESGEFRLLARERLAEERKGEDTLSLMFYAPRFGYSGDTGFQSPEFRVPRDSKNGRLLQQAFDLNKSGSRPFAAKLPGIDPEGLIRVRIKVRRIDENGERRFEVEDVIACHWYSTNELGMPASPPPAETETALEN